MATEHHTCVDCGQGYTLSAEEMRTYLERGWHLPKRCPACLARRRQDRNEQGTSDMNQTNQSPAPSNRREPTPGRRRPGSAVSRRRSTSWWGNPFIRFTGLSLVLTGLVVIGAVSLFGLSFWVVLIAWLAGINLATLLVFRYDKMIAKGSWVRVPERVLLGLAFLGGSPAAYVAMYRFGPRHKTDKTRFWVVYWAIVVVQVIGLIALAAWAGGLI